MCQFFWLYTEKKYAILFEKFKLTGCYMIFEAITALAGYGEKNGFFEKEDRVFIINALLGTLGLDSYEEIQPKKDYSLEEILSALLDYAVGQGLCEDSVTYRDLFDTKLMGLLLPRPSEVNKRFWDAYKSSPESATAYYYDFSKKTDYIREYRIARDVKWIAATPYGDMDITINLSKPEKDPKAIAAALTAKNVSYPRCMLCRENEGYYGRADHPARENLRLIPVGIGGGEWFLQYSPYVYYNEHCIVLNGAHIPMVIDKNVFIKLFDFVRQFPHYFVGSNADLPIVGGSILTHEHFQGGNYTFAMAKAPVETPFQFKGFEDIEAGIVRWPMSVIRLTGNEPRELVELADKILKAWRGYTDGSALIFAETDGVPHNTVTPIARFADGQYQLDLVLRNNITTERFPDGVYHPHPEHHHIKKENIGLIEVMGLAVLPPRLDTELRLLKEAMLADKPFADDERISKHGAWVRDILVRRTITPDNADEILKDEVGKIFAEILEQCGVFARTDEGKAQFLRFLTSI